MRVLSRQGKISLESCRVGRGKKGRLGDPGSELCLGREKENEKCEDNTWYRRR